MRSHGTLRKFWQESRYFTDFVTGGATVNIVLSMVRFYTVMLESNPLITKSVTCSGVAALGNVISQVMQQKVKIYAIIIYNSFDTYPMATLPPLPRSTLTRRRAGI